MISDLKPYANYKESGLPWLDTVPKHWDVAPNRALMRDQREVVGARASGYTLLSLTLRGVIARDMVNPKGKFPAQFSTYKVVKPDDFVFCLFDIDETPRGVGLSPLKGMITGAYDVFSPTSRINARFLYYYYLFVDEGKLMKPLYTGLRKTIQRGVFSSLKAPLPPPDEQAAIVRLLDWANGRLERAIRAKRKVIALLNEQKQAIIHRAVTRGLDPSVPLKPSGISWLGDIPQHWTLKRFKFLATINSGQVDPRKAEYRDLVLIAPNHIQSGSGRLLKQETAEDQGADSGKYLVRRGQIIYSKIRPNLCKAAIAPCDCLCSADMYPIDPTTGELSTDYLLLLLLSQPFTKFAVDTSMRVAMPKVNREALANCLMWYPGANEQSLIREFIAREAAPIDAAITRLEREIELLREYRTRLVADVVTGKLDVRHAAARLPDETPLDTIADAAKLGDETEAADEEVA